jgi:hypothetical protein
MTALDRPARIAGILYLIVIATGFFSLAYVPSQVNLVGDAESVARNIMANQSLYRLDVMSWLIKMSFEPPASLTTGAYVSRAVT